jgi:hypothetical protein
MPLGAQAAAPAIAVRPPFLANNAHQDMGGGDDLVDERRLMPAPASIMTSAPPVPSSSARKLKHFFRRPPTRSASDPPAYASVRRGAEEEGMGGVGAKRRASEVAQVAPREVIIERSRMPRLPSARDLIRKLT